MAALERIRPSVCAVCLIASVQADFKAKLGLPDHFNSVGLLTADSDELVARLLQRAQEQGRADDTEEVIRRRMAVYAEQTEPLVQVYAERGLLVEVDGMGSMDEVTARLLAAVGR